VTRYLYYRLCEKRGLMGDVNLIRVTCKGLVAARVDIIPSPLSTPLTTNDSQSVSTVPISLAAHRPPDSRYHCIYRTRLLPGNAEFSVH